MIAGEHDCSIGTIVTSTAAFTPVIGEHVHLGATCRILEREELHTSGRAGNALEGDRSETWRDDAFGDGDGGRRLFGAGNFAYIVRVEI